MPHFIYILRICGNECTARRGSDDLVTIKRKYANVAKGSNGLTIESRPESFGSVFNNRNLILLCDRHYPVDPCRHAVQMNNNDRFRFFTLPYPIADSDLKEIGRHIPGRLLTIYKHRSSPEINDRIG